MNAATTTPDTDSAAQLLLAFELGDSRWKLGFVTQGASKPRLRTIDAGDMESLAREIAAAKKKLRARADAKVLSCYEAGRDGFWIHRALTAAGIENVVIDPTCLQVDKRGKQAKTDRIDLEKMLRQLRRYCEGQRDALRVVRVPSVEEEDERRLNRERERLKKERGAHVSRVKSLLVLHGVRVLEVRKLEASLDQVRCFDGSPLPPGAKGEIKRELQRLAIADEQFQELERKKREELKRPASKAAELAAQLMTLRGLGPTAAWMFSFEIFSWRDIRNRRELASLLGLCPTPYRSAGTVNREQGISKAGNRRIRAMTVEIAWLWIRFQPASALTKWFLERFGSSGSRSKRVGIVALARKLVIELWKFLQTGEVPAGAVMKA